jgi:hypothetical protein
VVYLTQARTTLALRGIGAPPISILNPVGNRTSYAYTYSGGRFLSEDPLGILFADVNLYRYASNKPTIATDPSGQQIVERGVAGGCATAVWPAGTTIVVVGGGAVVAGGVAGCLLYQTVTQPLLEPTLTEWVSDWYCAKKDKYVCRTKARNWSVGTPCYGRIFESSGNDIETTTQAAWQKCFDAGCHTPGRGGDCGHSLQGQLGVEAWMSCGRNSRFGTRCG